MPSTLKLTSCTPINPQCKKKILTIWQSIRHSNDSVQFRNPVKWQQMGLYDYLDYVKQPMDLSTIQKKLKQQKYRTLQSFLDDMQLIFDNCKTYNTSGCWIYNLADKLQKSFHKMVRNFLPKIAKTNSHSKLSEEYIKNKIKQQAPKESAQQIQQQYLQEICYNQKVKFTQKLSHLSPQNIQKVVEVILKKCSMAIQTIQQQKPKQDKDIKAKSQSKIINNKQEIFENQEKIIQNKEKEVIKDQNQDQQIQKKNPQQIIEQKQVLLQDQIENDIKTVQKVQELSVGSRFQIFVDELNLQTFRQVMEMMEHMIEQKDKTSKRIKLQ